MVRDGLRDPSVLRFIAVPVVNVRHRTGLVIGDPVHRVAAEAEPGNHRWRSAPQIMWRGGLNANLGYQSFHQRA